MLAIVATTPPAALLEPLNVVPLKRSDPLRLLMFNSVPPLVLLIVPLYVMFALTTAAPATVNGVPVVVFVVPEEKVTVPDSPFEIVMPPAPLNVFVAPLKL